MADPKKKTEKSSAPARKEVVRSGGRDFSYKDIIGAYGARYATLPKPDPSLAALYRHDTGKIEKNPLMKFASTDVIGHELNHRVDHLGMVFRGLDEQSKKARTVVPQSADPGLVERTGNDIYAVTRANQAAYDDVNARSYPDFPRWDGMYEPAMYLRYLHPAYEEDARKNWEKKLEETYPGEDNLIPEEAWYHESVAEFGDQQTVMAPTYPQFWGAWSNQGMPAQAVVESVENADFSPHMPVPLDEAYEELKKRWGVSEEERLRVLAYELAQDAVSGKRSFDERSVVDSALQSLFDAPSGQPMTEAQQAAVNAAMLKQRALGSTLMIMNPYKVPQKGQGKKKGKK